jgi:hypothetical protein
MSRLVLAFVLVASSALAAPGEAWDITMQIDMPGLPPGSVPVNTVRSCGPKRGDGPPFTGARPGDDCKVMDAKQTGSTWTWKMACSNGVKGSGSITLEGTTAFSGKSEIEMEGQAVATKISGKLVGPCDYKGPPATPGAATPAPAPKKGAKAK